MTNWIIIGAILAYFGALYLISHYTGRNSDDSTWFRGNRSSPWYVVAFGMLGTTLSGVTFISVPGRVGDWAFAYLQLTLGMAIGFAVIALVLIPLYYRLNLTSIYGYLGRRLGPDSYLTGAGFFLLSRVIGASFRLYLVAMVFALILERMGFQVPFAVPVAISIALIYLYTRRGGIKTVIWTDTLQTAFLLTAALLTVWWIIRELDFSAAELWTVMSESSRTDFWFVDWGNKDHWFKALVGGAFLAIAMSGLDQDIMQKNLTCRTVTDSQKNLSWFCVFMVLANVLFLTLGFLLYQYGEAKGLVSMTEVDGQSKLRILDAVTGEWTERKTDELYPVLALDHLGWLVALTFILGLVAAAYSSADSALTALTTSFCVDFLKFGSRQRPEGERTRIRGWVQLGFAGLLFLVIVLFELIGNRAVINAIFKIAQYTYGPLLGLFAFGLLSSRRVVDKWTPLICVLAPGLSWVADYCFSFGYFILPFNGALTFAGLWLISRAPEAAPEAPAD